MSTERLQYLAGLPFAKMNGTGNDFVMVDNRDGKVKPKDMSLLAKAVCMRGRSVGADGLILFRDTDRVDPALGPVDFAWDFFNADGSSAEMCGNGGRCAARFAFERGLAKENMTFDTLAGPIQASVKGTIVTLRMSPPVGAYRAVELSAAGAKWLVDGINTGVPHAVLTVEDIEAAPVRQAGRELRFHQHFQPAGSNVNFMQPVDGVLMVRTYERGVEDETLACGTGAVASALMAGDKGLLESPVEVRVRSGETLFVHFKKDGDQFSEVLLEGPAAYAYEGRLSPEAFAWLGD